MLYSVTKIIKCLWYGVYENETNNDLFSKTRRSIF
jgi:hypothetical protein